MALVSDYAFVGFDRAVVVDVETTGLDPNRDRIVSFAALRADFSKLKLNAEANVEALQARLNPQVHIPAETSRIHGITNADVKDEDTFPKIAESLRDFIGDLPIIGHNVQFDKSFLSAEFKRAGVKSLYRNRSYCTMKRLRDHYRMAGEDVRFPKLEDAADLFKIECRKGQYHDAVEDAMTALTIAVALYKSDSIDGRVRKPADKKQYYETKRRGPERHYDFEERPAKEAREDIANDTKRQGRGITSRSTVIVIGLLVLLFILGVMFQGS